MHSGQNPMTEREKSAQIKPKISRCTFLLVLNVATKIASCILIVGLTSDGLGGHVLDFIISEEWGWMLVWGRPYLVCVGRARSKTRRVADEMD